jgi:hypothetical protein
VKYASGNVPDGFTKHRKVRYGRLSATMMTSIVMADFVPEALVE